MSDEDKVKDEILAMLSMRDNLAKAVYAHCEPQIATVCHLLEEDKEVSEETLESLFDRLLDHCYDERIKQLFTALCKAAEKQHPGVVKDYRGYYKELWND